eukprot:SAG25_NODE_128_length_14556_cov_11.699405_10_plen_71_part_00
MCALGSYVASCTGGANSGWLRVCVWVCVAGAPKAAISRLLDSTTRDMCMCIVRFTIRVELRQPANRAGYG